MRKEGDYEQMERGDNTDKNKKSKSSFLSNKYIILLTIATVILTITNILILKGSVSSKITPDIKKEDVLAINGEIVKKIYTNEIAIEDSLKAFGIIAKNSYNCPVRSFLKTKNQDLTIMPASITEKDDETNLAVKILSIVPGNRNKGLPLIPGKLLLYNEETGFLKALIDGGMVTNLRTGATAGATSKVLHPDAANNVVIFGCGAQGRYGLESILSAHPEVKKVTCFDYFQHVAKNFQETYASKGDGRTYIEGTQDVLEQTVREADIIHCATTSKESLFKEEWIKDGTHISAIGAYTLEMRELPIDIFKRNNVKLFVDQYQAMEEEAGDIMAAVKEGYLKKENIKLFGQIVNKEEQGRTDSKQITICKFVGVAPQDVVAASTIYNLAVEKGLGVVIPF